MNELEKQNEGFLYKIGIPPNLAWGFLGVLIFMIGDGIEQGWISPYLVDNGFTVQQAASLLTVYGITVAIAAWFSGVLVDMLGPKQTMTLGLILYLAGTISFISLGLSSMNEAILFPTYALRGFGYPLFAYSFLVWISYSSPKENLGKAVGWFWFVFSGGLFVMGAFSSSYLIPAIGHIPTLWTSVLWALIGAFFALVLNRDKIKKDDTGDPNQDSKLKELLSGITIMKEEPKVFVGGVVRVINSLVTFAFPVFIPLYMIELGYTTEEWLKIWGTLFTANIIFNLIFGFVGDKLGWRNTIMWFGGVGTALSTLALYYVPQFFPGNATALLIVTILLGAFLAGYVPLSALIPSLVKKEKGAAMSVLNLGAGLPTFVGPALVGLLIGPIGSTGVVWVLAAIYLLGALLTKFLTIDTNISSAQDIDDSLADEEIKLS
ncbi:MFS transporter [Oceanobacillus jeddahense]|uniref:MFS transporter n=1 Tax=Oceanobacillus jeddahense TaxID=1462527 RepID=A0ABY5JU61_9BACI|nr:MFS transporter [Oceanobacillus jeddahense]UUI03631.1 MFS transporter [Oceanobacillus jeddahense]